MGIKIKEGKSYTRRDGKIVKPQCQGKYWQAEGWHYDIEGVCKFLGQSRNDNESEYDLVSEYAADQSATTGFTIPVDDEEDKLPRPQSGKVTIINIPTGGKIIINVGGVS